MEKENLPKLPFNLEPKIIYWENFAEICILAEDDKCVYRFYWNGFDESYRDFTCKLKVEFNPHS